MAFETMEAYRRVRILDHAGGLAHSSTRSLQKKCYWIVV